MTPHIEAKLEDIAPNVIMPGDPNRAKYIAENFLTDAKLVNTVRGELAFTGYYNGVKVTIFSSGMGIPSMGIYSYELFKYYNVQNIIRIGSAGSYTEDLNVKDILLVNECYSKSSYKIEGKNKEVLSSNNILNKKIMLTNKMLGLNITLGNTYCAESFYELDLNVKDLIDKYNVKCVEMETYSLFTNSIYFNRKASAILTISDSFVTKTSLSSEEREKGFNDMIKLALESIANL